MPHTSVPNALYAQSGGVTAVINTSACAVIETARCYPEKIGTVYAAHNGILGALQGKLIDTRHESDQAIRALHRTPGGAFGSCRYKLKSLDENPEEYQRLLAVFKAYNIGYFFYNGGNDSMDTALKISQLSERSGYPVTCIGIPKTIDNDLAGTDCCPGFGSAAKYLAISTQEASLDIASMCETSTKVFVMEVMGRNAGWLAAATGLVSKDNKTAPHIILFPEVPLDKKAFLQRVQQTVEQLGYCVIITSEGIRYKNGKFISSSSSVVDAFGHHQLGGAAPTICSMIKQTLGYKYHYAVPDYLQRSARHIASQVDVDQAYAVGKYAVESAVSGHNAIMTSITRESDSPYRWSVGKTSLKEAANTEYKLPASFIAKDGFHITPACKEYLAPLIEGEDYPIYNHGLPQFAQLKKIFAPNKLKAPFEIA